MHHLYPTSTGDPLCPLGFHPQVRWPTRCKRCFRDYKDHKDQTVKKPAANDTTASTPSLSIWEQPTIKIPSKIPESKRGWASTSSLAKDDSDPVSSRTYNSTNFSSSSDVPSTNFRSASLDADDNKVMARPPRPKTYSGAQSDSLNFRRYSVDVADPERPQRLQIKGVIEKSNGTSSDTDAEYVIKVRKPNQNNQQLQNGPKINSAARTDSGKMEKSEVERLEIQLGEMRMRCERLEKEKSEILMRRMATMESNISVASKSSANEILKLQKYIKELQTKHDALCEDKKSLSAKLKSVEKELNTKVNNNEKDRVADELKSKLKAAETLCESLMDENEDMKKEIRELEEEIYEMQDTFREEQADEYTTIKRNLEQSNKNCRILSFKLRKVERKAEQLEADKVDLEQKYDQLKRIEEILKKVSSEYKNSSTKKPQTGSAFKSQLKKLADGMEQDLSDILHAMMSMTNNKDVANPNGANAKNEQLQKEYDLLQEKFDKTGKELTDLKKTQSNLKDDSLSEVRKKLEETINSSNAERRAWESDRIKLQDEKEKLKSKLLSLSADKLKVYNEVVQLKKDLERASLTEREKDKLERNFADLKTDLVQEKEKSKKIQEELSVSLEKESRISKTLASIEKAKSQLEDDLKLKKTELENIKNSNVRKVTELTSEINSMKKEKDKLKSQLEKENQAKDSEIANLKRRNSLLEKVDMNSKNIDEVKKSYANKITNLENEVKKSTDKFQELHLKQAKLVEAKCNLEKENQLLSGQILDHKQDYITLQAELEEIRQFYMARESEWEMRNRQLQEQMQDYQKLSKTISQGDLKEDNIRLKNEITAMTEQINDLRKANDDLSSKLKDYTAVSKVQRNLAADSSALEAELRIAKNTILNADKAKKADLAQCKLRYEQRVSAITDELKSIQTQLSRYKRERDTYKQMLEGAQKTIAELKSAARSRKASGNSTGKSDEDEESIANNKALIKKQEKQICALEDEISDSKLDVSKLKTELVSEQSAWQIKFAEMQSKINELEEERLLASGRTKVPGLKVRMELAWQKEREEQQRLLQETATLARDLRQTLFEVERERDKERLENKRKLEQLKKAFDEEKDENKKKLVELQCDLLELRDAHAKLRTSNEKMRRERERYEREREEMRTTIANKRRQEQTEARNINLLLQQVDDLTRLFPEMNGTVTAPVRINDKPFTPTPPRRTKSKSRETSPKPESLDGDSIKVNNSVITSNKTEKLEYTVKKLMDVAKELQESKKAVDESINKAKKMSKRSTSTDHENGRPTQPARTKPALKRKSLSLEQTAGRSEQSIWGNNSAVSSVQSLNGSDTGSMHFSLQRDSSIESRLSNESTMSDILPRERRHGKGIMKKIATKLTKSSSVDDPNTSIDSWLQTSESETSVSSDAPRSGKKNLKKKLSDMFKRGSKSDGLNKRGDSSRESSRPASRMSTVSSKR